MHSTCSAADSRVTVDDTNVGLVNGELAIPGYLLRREVFDPVVEQVNKFRHRWSIFPVRNSLPQVLNLIEEQTKKVDQRIDALLLVGGFSGSEYLFKRVDVRLTVRSFILY